MSKKMKTTKRSSISKVSSSLDETFKFDSDLFFVPIEEEKQNKKKKEQLLVSLTEEEILACQNNRKQILNYIAHQKKSSVHEQSTETEELWNFINNFDGSPADLLPQNSRTNFILNEINSEQKGQVKTKVEIQEEEDKKEKKPIKKDLQKNEAMKRVNNNSEKKERKEVIKKEVDNKNKKEKKEDVEIRKMKSRKKNPHETEDQMFSYAPEIKRIYPQRNRLRTMRFWCSEKPLYNKDREVIGVQKKMEGKKGFKRILFEDNDDR